MSNQKSKTAIETLRRHNRWRRWRRDDEVCPPEDPKAIGEAIDFVCDRVEELESVVRAATVMIAAKGRHNTQLAYEGLRDSLYPADETCGDDSERSGHE